jgi:hypothetical protein
MRIIMMLLCTLVAGCATDAKFVLTYRQTLKDFSNEVAVEASPKGVGKISWNISPNEASPY